MAIVTEVVVVHMATVTEVVAPHMDTRMVATTRRALVVVSMAATRDTIPTRARATSTCALPSCTLSATFSKAWAC